MLKFRMKWIMIAYHKLPVRIKTIPKMQEKENSSKNCHPLALLPMTWSKRNKALAKETALNEFPR